MIDKLLQMSLDEVKIGYAYNPKNKIFTCLACGKEFEMGEMFTFNGRFYDASKAIMLHIEKEHGTMLDILTSFDKKYTGITDNQKELLSMIYNGLSDNDIAKKTGVASATIRLSVLFSERRQNKQSYILLYLISLKKL